MNHHHRERANRNGRFPVFVSELRVLESRQATGDPPINGCHPFIPNVERSTPFRWTR